MFESDKYIAQRKSLIHNLKRRGIRSNSVLNAMLKVPRQYFMLSAYKDFAYNDDAFPIQQNQTISQPYTVAYQTQLLDLKPLNKVLEIGTGSGYQTAVLQAMNAEVYTIERIEKLHLQAKKTLEQLDMLPKCILFDDGYKGLPEYAPFDRIIITAAVSVLPEKLKEQLKIGGVLVAPIGENLQVMTVYEKLSNTKFNITKYSHFRFVPLVKNKKYL